MQHSQRFTFLVCLAASVFWGCTREEEASGIAENPVEVGAAAKAVSGPVETHGSLPGAPEDQGAGQPAIAFAHTEFDFGEVEQGESVDHIFAFRNTGTAGLTIERVRSG